MRRFELSDGKSNKFWSVKRKGAVVTVSYGRIGTGGQTKDKAHRCDAAETAMEKLVASKTKKGYVEVGAEAANKSVSKAKKAAPKKSATKRVVPTESLLAASGARPKSSPVFDVAALRKPIASWMRKEKPSTKYLRKPDDFVALSRRSQPWRLAARALAATMSGGRKSADAAEYLLSALARNTPAEVKAAADKSSGSVEMALRAMLAKAAPKKEAERSRGAARASGGG